MFKTTAPDSSGGAYVDKNISTSTPGTKIIAEDKNRDQDELVNAVESSGQTLDASKVDLSQLARAMTIISQVALLGTDTGAADAYVVDLDNADIIKPTSYAQLDGAMIMFSPANPNTGIAATLNFEGLGAKSLTDRTGATLSASDISGNVIVVYNLGNDRFELFLNNAQATAATESSAGVAEIATQAEVDTGTDDLRFVTSLKLQNKIDDNVFGINQSWQDVSGSRAINTTYTNITTKPFQLAIVAVNPSNAGNFTLTINGNALGVDAIAVGTSFSFPFAIINPGDTYRISHSGGGLTINSWYEFSL